MSRRGALVAAALWLLARPAAAAPRPTVAVGSKAFTENVLLGEIAAHLIRDAGADVQTHRALGGTSVLFHALLSGEIDVYAEYSGTLVEEILSGERPEGPAGLAAALARRGVRLTRPLGFNNTYALGLLPATGERLAIGAISDLAQHPALRLGFSNEFLDRADGWPGLRARYALPQADVRGLDHDLAYRGLVAGDLDVIDVYTTDAEIAYYGLRVLADDRRFFSRYDAVLLYRADLERRAPAVPPALARLEGRIDETAMRAMNAAVKLDGRSEGSVAAEFVARRLGVAAESGASTLAGRLWRRTREHLLLVGVALGAGIAAAVPLGVVAAKRPRLGALILGLAGVLQTIPSLALLVFMIPLLGIAEPPAIAALFLYSLLPMVRNTHAGLRGIPPAIEESAEALGLSPAARLFRVELPLASPAILAGIKTSTVIVIGFATLGALIGAGGYGQPIFTGIRLDDFALILEGAVPAALLALVAQGLFGLAERLLVPRGLRLTR